MNGEPVRNSYLRSEIANFLRTLAAVGAAVPHDSEYRRGWLAALTALSMLIGVSVEVER